MFVVMPGIYVDTGDRNLETHDCATWHIMNLPISVNLWYYFKHFLQCFFGGFELIVWWDIEMFVGTHLLWSHKFCGFMSLRLLVKDLILFRHAYILGGLCFPLAASSIIFLPFAYNILWCCSSLVMFLQGLDVYTDLINFLLQFCWLESCDFWFYWTFIYPMSFCVWYLDTNPEYWVGVVMLIYFFHY